MPPRSPLSKDHLFGPIGPAVTIDALNLTIAELKTRGFTPPRNSRLHQAIEHLTELLSRPEGALRSTTSRRLAAEAQRLAFAYYVIARALAPKSTTPPRRLHRAFQQSFSGVLDPAVSSQSNRRARDIEFELWLAAFFAAGDRPVIYQEPDLQVTCWFSWHGVAAKRLQTPKSLLGQVKAAAAQIKRQGRPGFICVMVDCHSRAWVKRLAGLRSTTRYFARIPEIAHAAAWIRAQAPWVVAVMYVGTRVRWELTRFPPHAVLDYPTRIETYGRDPVTKARLRDFWNEVTTTYTERMRGL
jgi:hypothetical protein